MEADQENVICDKCGEEFPADQSMPFPEDDRGDLCFECYGKVSYQWDVKRGEAWLKAHLPNFDDFMVAFNKHAKVKYPNYSPTILIGNCHAAANALVKMMGKKMDIKLERGHWLGGDIREERSQFPMQQHSWTKVNVPNISVQFIVDPTQWVFTGATPSLTISNEDDSRYDMGGYNAKLAIIGKTPIPAREGKLVRSGLSKSAWQWLNAVEERDWTQWTPGEMIVIANMDPRGTPKELFTAIIKCGNIGFIPLDGRDYLGL